MEKQDIQQRLWTQVFVLWSPSGAAGDCEERSHGWKQNLIIHFNRKLMRSLSCSVVCWRAVSSMPSVVSPVKPVAKLFLFLAWAGSLITFIKDSSSYKGLSAVPGQSPKHLFFLQFICKYNKIGKKVQLEPVKDFCTRWMSTSMQNGIPSI